MRGLETRAQPVARGLDSVKIVQKLLDTVPEPEIPKYESGA